MNQNIDNNTDKVKQAGRDITENFFPSDPASMSNRVNWLLSFSVILVILQIGSLGKSLVINRRSSNNPDQIINSVRHLINQSNSDLLLSLNTSLDSKLIAMENRISRDRKYDIINVEKRIELRREKELKALENRILNQLK